MFTSFQPSSILNRTQRSNSVQRNRRKRRQIKKDRTNSISSRIIALEQAYVHDVYSAIASNSSRPQSPVQSHVKHFIFNEFDSGSILLDIGCGDGKYLNLSSDIVIVGLEHCGEWFKNDQNLIDNHNLLVGDLLYLPFRDELFDGVLCCSVLHHLSTLERRVNALKEIARIMKIGGKVMLTVTSRPNVESQDVLIRVDTTTTTRTTIMDRSKPNKHSNNIKRDNQLENDGNYGYLKYQNRSNSNSSLNSSCSSNDSSQYDDSSHHYSDSKIMSKPSHETLQSPTNSELENCYSFVKKALKRFSLATNLNSARKSFTGGGGGVCTENNRLKLSPSLTSFDEIYPIELRSLEEYDCDDSDEYSSSSSNADSALDSSFARSSSGCVSQTSSNNFFPSSLMSAIKDRLVTLKVQFANSMAWYSSFDSKMNVPLQVNNKNCLNNGKNRKSNDRMNELKHDNLPTSQQHRLSLPASLRNNQETQKERNRINNEHSIRYIKRNKVHALANDTGNLFSSILLNNFNSIGGDIVKQVELNFDNKFVRRRSCFNQKLNSTVDGEDDGGEVQVRIEQSIISSTSNKVDDFQPSERQFLNNKFILQKSFSSESSHRASIECRGYKLIAYYSMPELRTLDSIPQFGLNETFISSDHTAMHDDLLDSMDIKEYLLDSALENDESFEYDQLECCCIEDLSLNSEIISNQIQNNEDQPIPKSIVNGTELPKTILESEFEESIVEEMKDNPGTLNQTTSSKLARKLLRQRSFSADYQPEMVKFQPELPRRFSASPNIETHRYNNNDHTPHHQQISIESEESFVTIIPAMGRTPCESMTDMTSKDQFTDGEFEEEEEEEKEELDPDNNNNSPNNDIFSYSDDDDENAYCENFSNEMETSEDDTSVSSMLEATIRSVVRSDSNDTRIADELPFELTNNNEKSRSNNKNPFTTTDDDCCNIQFGNSQPRHSPPSTLHQYYHVFREGELENLIEQHVHNLHIIDSFYNECATSWCIIAEKIQVWTI